MPDDLTISKLAIADTESLCEFFRDEDTAATYRPYGEVTLATLVNGPIVRLAEGNEVGFVIRNQRGRILGHAFLRRHPTQRTTWGLGIGLHPAIRGKGWGTKLMREILDGTREQDGVDRVELSVLTENTPAVRLYERFGFQTTREARSDEGRPVLYMLKCYSDRPDDADEILAGQRQRRELLYGAYRSAARDWYDDRGNWILSARQSTHRENYWHALPFLASPNPADHQRVMPILEKEVHYFCAFAPFAALQILCKYRDKLTDLARERLTDYVAENLPKSCTADFQFHGYNDNMPAMKAFVLLAGGELLSEKKYVDQGLANLCQLRSLLVRRGMLNEFNSPTYTGVTMLALAEITNHVKNAYARELAAPAEERVFSELVFHWHRETSGLAGPYSRAYSIDSVGHVSMANTAMWLIWGDDVFINPLRYFFGGETEKIVLHAVGCLPVNQNSSVWVATPDYHPHPELIDYLKQAQYPRMVRGTTEAGEFHPQKWEISQKDGSYKSIRTGDVVHPPRSFSVASHITRRWALGTSLGYFCDGKQSDVFHLRYVRRDPPEGVEDIRTIYARYLINERSCYVDSNQAGDKGRFPADILGNEGRGFAFQKGGTAMACYQPLPYGQAGGVESLRLRLLLFCKQDPPERIDVAEDRIVLNDAGLRVLFKPMVNSQIGDLEGASTVETCRDGDWLCIDIFNYRGPEREFTDHEIRQIANGFVVEVSDGPLQEEVLQAQPLDRYYMHQRRIRYARDGVELSVAYDPVSMGIRCATIDGRDAFSQSMLEVSDYGVGRKLPWIAHKDPQPPEGFDWPGLIESRKQPW